MGILGDLMMAMGFDSYHPPRDLRLQPCVPFTYRFTFLYCLRAIYFIFLDIKVSVNSDIFCFQTFLWNLNLYLSVKKKTPVTVALKILLNALLRSHICLHDLLIQTAKSLSEDIIKWDFPRRIYFSLLFFSFWKVWLTEIRGI